MPLRSYQLDLLHNLRFALRSHNRVLAVLPTGGGKTQIFCHIASLARSHGKSVQVLVHRRELLYQTPDPSVETIQSWQPTNIDLVIVDEAHHACARTWLEKLSTCKRILGFTATPQRLDGGGLDVLFDYMVTGPNTKQLIQSGWLSPYKIFCPPDKPDLSSVRKKSGDYNRQQLDKVVSLPKVVAAAVKNWQRFADNRQTIAFCASVAHMHSVASNFKQVGISCDTIDGRLSKSKRDNVIQRFRLGEITVLLSVDLISEGFDVPNCDCVLLLRPTRSLCLHLQQVGRALRPSHQHAVILDAAGNSERLGLPDDDRYWSLQGITKQKFTANVPIRTCPQCYYVHKPHLKSCPSCSYLYPLTTRVLKESNVFLQEINQIPTSEIKEIEDIQLRRRQVNQARTESELQQIAKQRGYKPGWVYKVLQSRLQSRL